MGSRRAGYDRPGGSFKVRQQRIGYKARARRIQMAIALRSLPMDKKTLWHQQMQIVFCPRHCHVEQPTFFLELGTCARTQIRWHAPVNYVQHEDGLPRSEPRFLLLAGACLEEEVLLAALKPSGVATTCAYCRISLSPGRLGSKHADVDLLFRRQDPSTCGVACSITYRHRLPGWRIPREGSADFCTGRGKAWPRHPDCPQICRLRHQPSGPRPPSVDRISAPGSILAPDSSVGPVRLLSVSG
jgi:hypothetical protein